MKRRVTMGAGAGTAVLALLLLAGCQAGFLNMGQEPLALEPADCDPNDGGIELPDGFCAVVVVEDLDLGEGVQARHLAVDEDGDVYVMLRRAEEGTIAALRDTTGDGKADIVRRFGRISGTGIRLHDGYLYASTDTSIVRYRMTGGLVPLGAPEVVLGGFPDQGSHAAKSFTFDDEGHIYVNVGAPANACQEQARTPGSPGMDPCPLLEWQSGIWRARADQTGQTQRADAERYATGIRNAVALAWNPAVDELYLVQHGRDQLNTLFPEHYTDEQGAELPAEEFFLVEEGDDFGWPYCYYDHFQEQKVLSPEYGGDGEEVGRCAQKEDPILAFPAHYAPNDLLFYTAESFPERYEGGAFVAFHGSWNRAPFPQKGYLVAFVPFSGAQPSGDWEVFADGFAGETPVESPSDAEFRAMGLALGPDGSLYISDSAQGRIWRVIYTG